MNACGNGFLGGAWNEIEAACKGRRLYPEKKHLYFFRTGARETLTIRSVKVAGNFFVCEFGMGSGEGGQGR